MFPEEGHSLPIREVTCHGSREGLGRSPQSAFLPPSPLAGPPRMLVHTKVACVQLPVLRDRASWEGAQGLRGQPSPWVDAAFHAASHL